MKERDFHQFIITRFNVVFFHGEQNISSFVVDKQGDSTQTDQWLEERFELFEKYCIPSVEIQTNKNFTWLCLFDTSTPKKYKEHIAKLQEKHPQLKAHYVEPVHREKLYLPLDAIMREYMGEGVKYVLTSNLDNDDSFHKNYTLRFEEAFLEDRRPLLYRFVYGKQYFEDNNYLINMRYPHNHFLALTVELGEEPMMNAAHYYHGRAHRELDYRDVETEPLWLEVVHSTNVNNDFRIGGRIKYLKIRENVDLMDDFGVDVQIERRENRRLNNTFLPATFLKTAARKLTRKVKRKFVKSE